MADDLARSFQNIDLGGLDDEAKKAKDLAKKQKRKAAEKEKRKAENKKIIEEKRHRLKEEVKSIVFEQKKPVHPIKQNIWDFKDIIDHIRRQPNPPSCFEEQSPADFPIIEAAYKSNADILSQITKMLKEFYDAEDYAIKVPSRGKQHQEYDKVHQSIKLKDNYFLRKLTPEPNDMFMVTMCVLLEIFQLCEEEIDANIRDIYYTNTTLYKNEDRINNAIDDICCILHCPRACLRLFASQKGYVLGNLYYTCGGEEVDCASDGFGQAIPVRTDLLTSMRTNKKPDFILLVEKHSVFVRLAQDSIWKNFNCIMITGSGMPDVATRYLLCKLAREFGLRVYGLFDSNPYGVRILCIYRYGSMNKSYDYRNLITPNIIWLGIKPTDLETYGIPDNEKCRVPMTTNDTNLCQSLIDAEFLNDNAQWRLELQHMRDIGTKTEIEAFYTFGYKSLANVFIAHRLQEVETLESC